MVGRPQENSVMTSTITLQPLIADHATIPHVIAMNLPFHVRSATRRYRMTDKIVQYWWCVETWVPQPLSLSTGCFSEFGSLSYLKWKRGIGATCWSKNQHYCLTYRYFMIIFDVYLGSADIPLLFGLSLCNLMKQVRLPYPIWKGTCIPFIWGRVGWSASRGYRVLGPILV